MKAFLKNNRQAPRKVRLVADSVRGKNVAVALAELSMMAQKAAPVMRKLIASALANAQQKDANIKAEDVVVKTVTVDKGMTYVRYMPRAFGRATPIHRESSHIHVELAPVADSVAPVAEVATAEKATSKAAPKKKEEAKPKSEKAKATA
jgi:large subunit ribosomal protein L22